MVNAEVKCEGCDAHIFLADLIDTETMDRVAMPAASGWMLVNCSVPASPTVDQLASFADCSKALLSVLEDVRSSVIVNVFSRSKELGEERFAIVESTEKLAVRMAPCGILSNGFARVSFNANLPLPTQEIHLSQITCLTQSRNRDCTAAVIALSDE